MPFGSSTALGSGWSGTTSTGQQIVNGIPQSSGGTFPSASSSSSNASGISNSTWSNIGSAISGVLNRSDGALGDFMREANQVAQGNSALSQSFAREQMDYQTNSNRVAMDWSAQEAQKTRDWQMEMSNSSHQREVRDLMAAGLNPILSANNGASTPAGATGSAYASNGAQGNVDSSSMALLISSALTSAVQLKTLDVESQLQNRAMDNSLYMSHLNADAMLSAAGTAAAASMYGSDQARIASIYGADRTYDMGVRKLQVDRMISDANRHTQERGQDLGFEAQMKPAVGKTLEFMHDWIGNQPFFQGIERTNDAIEKAISDKASSLYDKYFGTGSHGAGHSF